jgi:pyruvate formate lyase activating enzyme
MKIGGLQKVSLIDYPGMICATLFTQGCNFRCPYCHNPELVEPSLFGECLQEEAVISFLEKRKDKLDAVSITGGEPTIQNDLIAFIKRLKRLKYPVKIDTNGSNPEVLDEIINGKLVDYIAMDIKGPLEKYARLSQSQIDGGTVHRSIKTVMSSGVPYEFRTTVLRSLLSPDDILEVGKLIKNADHYVLQQFVPSKSLDPNCIDQATYRLEELESIKAKLSGDIEFITIR